MKKFYYKISVNSSCGKNIIKFHRECQVAEKAADEYAAKMGAEAYHSSPYGFQGGVESLEFKDDKADEEVWKQLGVRNGRKIFVPNCEKQQGCVVFKKKFPKDTKDVIYQHKVLTWDEIKFVYTLKQWADMVHIKYKDINAEQEVIEKKMSKYHFVQYTKFSGDQVAYRKSKMSQTLLRAIKAENMRMKLPVVSTDKLYEMFGAVIKKAHKNEDTPTFFKYGSFYYISCDYPCSNKDLRIIAPQMYTLQRSKLNLDATFAMENSAYLN